MILLVLLVIAPLAALLVYNGKRAAEQELNRAEAQNLQRAQDVANQTAQFLRETRSLLAELAQRPQVRALDPQHCDPLFADQSTLFPRFSNIVTIRRTGELVCSAVEPAPGSPSKVDPAYYLNQVLQTGRFTVGAPARGFITGKWVVTLAQPILDTDKQALGIVALPIDLSKFWPPENAIGLPPDGRMRIISQQGTIIASSDRPEQWIGQNARPETLTMIAGGGQGVHRGMDRDDSDRIYSFARVPGFDWHVVVSLPRASVLADTWTLAIQDTELGLLALAAALLLAYLTARHIIRPVETIAATARRVANGDTTARTPVTGSIELVEVATDFNQMLDQLAMHHSERDKLSRRFESLMHNSHDIILLTDPEGRIVEANDAALAAYGYSAEELLRLTIRDLRAPHTLDQLGSEFEAAATPQGVLFETVHQRRDGSTFAVEVSASGLSVNGQIYRQSFVRDISQRQKIDADQQLAASVFSHAQESIIITDAQGTIVNVNEAFTRESGYARDEAIGKNPRILKSDRQGSAFFADLWRALTEHGNWAGEIWNRRKNGEVYAEKVTISAVRNADGQTRHYVSLATNITSAKKHQQQLEYVAYHDALTGLPNRLLQADRLHQAMVHCQRLARVLAVVYLDLDNFKTVNDQYGHDIGDALLVTLAMHLKNALREGDTLARIGGDEFIALITDLHQPEDAFPVIDRLMQAATRAVVVPAAHLNVQTNTLTLQVSASMGVTMYPNDAVDADQLLRHADQAMYVAKQTGKNRYHLFDVAEDAAGITLAENIERIVRGLERHEFMLHYQPKVNMASGQITGAEALIRWQHPERGLQHPADFLHQIEGQPVGVVLGEWVLETALTQISAWRAMDVYLPISVNISARQLQQVDFPERLKALLDAHPDVPPASLSLEVLETNALEDIPKASEAIRRCQALGVSFALDDFGTGYSSLTYLRRLPVETLKIDRSFVRDMLHDPNDLAIVKGVIGLAQAFGREVVAEGVETVAHGNLLLAVGCQQGQGYGIAEPMPAEAFPSWITRWNETQLWASWRSASIELSTHQPQAARPVATVA